jgi:hypothetical protein
VVRAHAAISAMPEVKIRTIRKKDIDQELRLIIDIWEDAWHENWGHVSMTPAEVKTFVETMNYVIVEDLALIAEIDGEPAAMCFAIPNINEAARDLRGKLFPFGFVKFLWRMFVTKPTTSRLILLGVKEKFRKQRQYGYLPMALVHEVKTRGERIGCKWGELGWTLETNAPVNVMIKAVGGEKYKTYRVYEKAL